MKKNVSFRTSLLFIPAILIMIFLVSGCSGFYYETVESNNEDRDRDVVRTITLSDGSTYTGLVSNEKPHGEGTLQYKDGGKYSGEFKQGQRHGQGEMLEPDGSVYVGTYSDDQKQGEGIYTFPDGKEYKGSFSEDLFDGNGELIWPDGVRYVGQWKKGEIHSNNTFSWPVRKFANTDLINEEKIERGFFFVGESHSPYIN